VVLAGVGAFSRIDPRDGLVAWFATVFGALYVGLIGFVITVGDGHADQRPDGGRRGTAGPPAHHLGERLARLGAAGVASAFRVPAGDAVYAAVAHHAGSKLVTLDEELLARAAPLVDACTPAAWIARGGEDVAGP